MSTAALPLPSTAPPRALRILVAAGPVCDGCRATSSADVWHLGEDGSQLCQACWRDCGAGPDDDGSPS